MDDIATGGLNSGFTVLPIVVDKCVGEGTGDVTLLITFSVALISVNTVVSSNSSNIVTLSAVTGNSSSVIVFIKVVICVDDSFGGFVVTVFFSVVVTDNVVGGFVGEISIVLGFTVGFLVTGTLLDEIIGFRVGKRVVSLN